MREILFKAKRKNWKELPKDQWWVAGSLVSYDADSGYVYISQPYLHASTLPVKMLICDRLHLIDIKTICQYTGLHDRTKWEELSEEEQQQFLSEWNYEKGRKNQKEDWKGKKIWENDIVKFEDTGEEGYEYKEGFDYINRAKVIWNKGRFELACYLCNNSGTLDLMNNSPEEFYDMFEVYAEVIGNVFDGGLDGKRAKEN